VDLGMPSSGKKVFPWTTENSAMSGSRASQEHEQRPCVDVVDRSGHLYLDDKNTRVSALETYGGYGHISVLCRILSGVGPIPYTAIGIHTFQLVWNSTENR
jgi:hypothetical protein